MSRRTMRALHKEMLLLQAEQYRLALRQNLDSLAPPRSVVAAAQSPWLDTLAVLAGAVLPARWWRWMNAGMSAWRIGKRLLAKDKPAAPAN